jgi:hypothetical protein
MEAAEVAFSRQFGANSLAVTAFPVLHVLLVLVSPPVLALLLCSTCYRGGVEGKTSFPPQNEGSGGFHFGKDGGRRGIYALPGKSHQQPHVVAATPS